MSEKYLEHSLEGVVIDVLVYVECCEGVERMAKVDLPRNSYIPTEDREKVSGTDYRVHMYDRHDPILIVINIGFNDPHAVVGVRVVEGLAKLVNECARKKVISNLKRKKQMNPRNFQTPHSWCV